MGIRADMDYALANEAKPQAFYMGIAAMHAYWADFKQGLPENLTFSITIPFVTTEHRGIPVIPTDWPSGWELAAA